TFTCGGELELLVKACGQPKDDPLGRKPVGHACIDSGQKRTLGARIGTIPACRAGTTPRCAVAAPATAPAVSPVTPPVLPSVSKQGAGRGDASLGGIAARVGRGAARVAGKECGGWDSNPQALSGNGF